ncbi:hypothetical protein BGX34_005651 [Mortierella sp. NVP85]|nr:hypothetical protein BGX34_005651 [Mortierella sp. NVP85]
MAISKNTRQREGPRRRKLDLDDPIMETTMTQKKRSSNPDKQAKREQQNCYTLKTSGCAISFHRVPTIYGDRYVCTCNSSFASSDALKVHVNGTQTAARPRDPCPEMAILCSTMVHKKHVFRKLVRKTLAFDVLSLKHMPGGFSTKLDIEDEEVESDVPEEEEQPNNKLN